MRHFALLLFLLPTSLAAQETWVSRSVPGVWPEVGAGWARCWVKVPKEWKGADVTLSLDKVHNAFEIYWNGKAIGSAGSFPPKYKDAGNDFFSFSIAEADVTPGTLHLLALRIHGQDKRAGFGGFPPVLIQETLAISLEGRWQYRQGDDASWAKPGDAPPDGYAVFSKVVPTTSITQGERSRKGGLTPAESAQTFTIPDDLRLQQVLAEPAVKQPVSISFDEKGRLWVVQYLQYPRPAGLQMLSRDIWWRAVYDKIPPPPPHGVPGKDRITIHEDTDGDGVYDKHSIFLDGLNIATAAARGRGGVWVLNPPYLLFYPTKDNADQPTGDPVVHLQGFGLEDTHSVVNSLRFGPDGWLYAAQGSTVTGAVQRPGDKAAVRTAGQIIWRYHPEKKKYEVFAEGGGNAFGVEFDAQGRLFSGHNGGNTRGFHYVQGGYYRKGFDKHGPLSNPYAFGFFEAMKHPNTPRFSHTFLINESPALPERYRGKLLAVSPLLSQVVLSEIAANGSSLQTKDLEAIVASSDNWFRPVDIKEGPDGAVYVADWYDGQLAHTKNHEGQMDGDTGRIYRLMGKDHKKSVPIDLGKKSSRELVGMLNSESRWQRETIRRLLGDRRDASIVPLCTQLLFASKGQQALEALWALHLSGGFTPEVAERALVHAEPLVRGWAVRLIGDEGHANPTLARILAELAAGEKDLHVRSQLASSARRLPAGQGLPIVRELFRQEADAQDIHLPLLLWWAIEASCADQREAVLALFKEPEVWKHAVVAETILPRVMRRFATAGTQKDLQTCLGLFRQAPDASSGQRLLAGFEEAFKGRSIAGLSKEILAEIDKLGGGSLIFTLRQGKDAAIKDALHRIRDAKTPMEQRLELIDVFGQTNQPVCVPVLLELVQSPEKETLRKAGLMALQAYRDPAIVPTILSSAPKWTGELRDVAESLLVSRREWCKDWLTAIDAGRFDAKSIGTQAVRKMLLHKDADIAALVKKHWGDVKGATTLQMKTEIDRLGKITGAGLGNPYPGKKLFAVRCAACHTLHGKGGSVGPDLTPFKRDDFGAMLLHIVNPSAEIREGYENVVLGTENGRVLNGIVVEKDNAVVVLRTADGQKVVLARSDVAEMSVTGVSLMPEALLQGLGDQDVRDLFAYLRSTQPLYDRD